jgi:hypothetical protein
MIIQAFYTGNEKQGYVPGRAYNLQFNVDSERGEDAVYIEDIQLFHSRGSYQYRKDSSMDYSTLFEFLKNWQVVNKTDRLIFNEQQQPDNEDTPLPDDIKAEIDKAIDIASLYLIHKGRPKWQTNQNFIKALSTKKAALRKGVPL